MTVIPEKITTSKASHTEIIRKRLAVSNSEIITHNSSQKIDCHRVEKKIKNKVYINIFTSESVSNLKFTSSHIFLLGVFLIQQLQITV